MYTLGELRDDIEAFLAKHPEAENCVLAQMDHAYGENHLTEVLDFDLHLHVVRFADGCDVDAPGEKVVLVDGDPGPPEHPDEAYCHDCCELLVDCVCREEENEEEADDGDD